MRFCFIFFLFLHIYASILIQNRYKASNSIPFFQHSFFTCNFAPTFTAAPVQFEQLCAFTLPAPHEFQFVFWSIKPGSSGIGVTTSLDAHLQDLTQTCAFSRTQSHIVILHPYCMWVYFGVVCVYLCYFFPCPVGCCAFFA